MTEDDLTAVPLSYLSNEARTAICRLNTRKLIPSDGPENLPRDYRGLAFCINVTSQNIDNIHQNKTEWLLQTWIHRNDGTANIHTLLLYLEQIDRHDIKDDLLELGRKRHLVNREGTWIRETVTDQRMALPEEDNLVTLEDIDEGTPVIYDALVLYAEADQDFVDEMIMRMSRDFGYKLCTKNSLRPGMAPFRSITELVQTRCRFVVLVYSPDFFESPDERFFMDYVHAWNIGSNQRRLLPCMYRQCKLPPHYSFYHNLHYNSAAYNFWDHLGRFLNPRPVPRVPALRLPSSTLKIQELSNDSRSNGKLANGRQIAYETRSRVPAPSRCPAFLPPATFPPPQTPSTRAPSRPPRSAT
ncbi:hypothetical protein MSG28_003709 [Choristoneura fumiferana]|uniref:Uncharacterized protein n=1 Tax=Choristoneura fumiferana TaxID=7141 RepID=A0ACC0KH51_CHOFU|nr:hypothetical protein MSG28_003709 [Choristoneura fumiferana]